MLSGAVILAVIAVLVIAAQLRAGHMSSPAPLAERITVGVIRTPQGIEVAFTGVRGCAFSFHAAHWAGQIEVIGVSGPLTLADPRDTRTYLIDPAVPPAAELRGVWEQTTFAEVTIAVTLSAWQEPSAGRETVGTDSEQAVARSGDIGAGIPDAGGGGSSRGVRGVVVEGVVHGSRDDTDLAGDSHGLGSVGRP